MISITLNFDSGYDAAKASRALSRAADRLEVDVDELGAVADAPVRTEIASLRSTAAQLTAGLREPV